MLKKTLFTITMVSAMIMMYACNGSENKPAAENTSPSTVSGNSSAVSIRGKEIYAKACIACHQVNGEGIAGISPPVAQSDFLKDKNAVIEQIIKGKSGAMVVNGITYNNIMPPQNLSDEDIAAVLTYVYSSWGNSGESISAEEVKTIRAK